MISLTCAVTGQLIFFNPGLIQVLEDAIVRDAPACRVYIHGYTFEVKEPAKIVKDIVEADLEHCVRLTATLKKEIERYI